MSEETVRRNNLVVVVFGILMIIYNTLCLKGYVPGNAGNLNLYLLSAVVILFSAYRVINAKKIADKITKEKDLDRHL